VALRGVLTNDFSPDYFTAVIDVTNASKLSAECWYITAIHFTTGYQAPKPYYKYRDLFESRTLPGHSGFSFETLVCGGSTNEIAMRFLQSQDRKSTRLNSSHLG